MNCFRHPTEVAVVYCKGCGKPLCWECSQRTFGNETQVCSEECARAVSQQPDSGEPRDSLFQTVYAAVFLVILLASLCGGLCVWGAQSAVFQKKLNAQIEAHGGMPHYDKRQYSNVFRIFYTLGITDWRAQFGIGAAVGAGSALVFMAKYLCNQKAGQ
jgi:hypothetical protein